MIAITKQIGQAEDFENRHKVPDWSAGDFGDVDFSLLRFFETNGFVTQLSTGKDVDLKCSAGERFQFPAKFFDASVNRMFNRQSMGDRNLHEWNRHPEVTVSLPNPGETDTRQQTLQTRIPNMN